LRRPFSKVIRGISFCLANCSMAATKARVIGSMALVERTWAFLWWRMKWSAPSKIWRRLTKTFKYLRSMDSSSRTTCFLNTSATVCGSFACGSACGVPLRPGDRLTVVPLMEVIEHLPSQARKWSLSIKWHGVDPASRWVFFSAASAPPRWNHSSCLLDRPQRRGGRRERSPGEKSTNEDKLVR